MATSQAPHSKVSTSLSFLLHFITQREQLSRMRLLGHNPGEQGEFSRSRSKAKEIHIPTSETLSRALLECKTLLMALKK